MSYKDYKNVANHLCCSGEEVCDNLSAVTCPYIKEVLTGKEITLEVLRKFSFILRVKKDTDGTYVILDCKGYKKAKKGQNDLQKEAFLKRDINDIVLTGYRSIDSGNSGRVLTKKIDAIIGNGGR